MKDPGSQLLAVVNRVRAVQELEPLGFLVMLGAEAGDEDACILAQAMRCSVGGASDPASAEAGRWVLRFGDRWTARMVALELDQAWHPEYLDVEAPWTAVDFVVAFALGEVEPDEIGFVRAWRVPADAEDPASEWCRYVMPGMESCASALVPA